MSIFKKIGEYRKKKQERTDYQSRKNAVRDKSHKSSFKIENEYDLNVALSLANRKLSADSYSYQEQHLRNALDFVENNMSGETRKKYENAILRRAERLHHRYMSQYAASLPKRDQEIEGIHRRYSRTLYLGSDPEAKMREEIQRTAENYESLKENASCLKEDLIDKLKGNKLEKKVAGTTAVISSFTGLLFLSSNITGQVISNLTNSTANKLGIVFIFLAIVEAIFYFKKK